jgi:hypothetical protein
MTAGWKLTGKVDVAGITIPGSTADRRRGTGRERSRSTGTETARGGGILPVRRTIAGCRWSRTVRGESAWAGLRSATGVGGIIPVRIVFLTRSGTRGACLILRTGTVTAIGGGICPVRMRIGAWR